MDYETITALATMAGFDSTLLAKLAIISIVANAVGRIIPDDATGVAGVVRKICKVIGIYVPNRITKDDSTVSVAKNVLHQMDDGK
jgi:hypothetical protein